MKQSPLREAKRRSASHGFAATYDIPLWNEDVKDALVFRIGDELKIGE